MDNERSQTMTLLRLPLFVCIAFAASCTYVKVSDPGAQVLQATATDVLNCREVGEIASQTRARVLLRRPAGKVAQELIDLARNQAANLGANAIVPIGVPERGMQKFMAYACQ